MKLIIAVNQSGYIGLNGGIPWKCKEDMKHFKRLTMQSKVEGSKPKLLVGRVTAELLPPLPGRELIIVGNGYYTLEEALALDPDWVIGGKKIYESVYHLCDEIHISLISDNTIGDVKYPEFKLFNNLSDHLIVHFYKFKSDLNSHE